MACLFIFAYGDPCHRHSTGFKLAIMCKSIPIRTANLFDIHPRTGSSSSRIDLNEYCRGSKGFYYKDEDEYLVNLSERLSYALMPIPILVGEHN